MEHRTFLSRLLCLFVLATVGVGCPPPEEVLPPDPPPPWPEWAFQPWVWEDESTQESALGLVDGYLEHDIDVGAIIIDSPWEVGYDDFVWDPDLYPDPAGLVDDLHDRGVRVLVWIVPVVNTDTGALWDEFVAGGYYMTAGEDSEGPAIMEWWKGEGALLDYGNPDAVAWWHELMQPVLDLGIDGWKCDGADFLATFASWSPGLGRQLDRLEYSHMYYRDFFEHTREVLGDDRLITARPVDSYGFDVGGDGVAFAPIDINWAGWVGDQDPDWDGIEAALTNFYWSSEYGYVAFGSDIGGYREDGSPLGRSEDTFLRWAWLGAFSPVMENGGGGEHRPWVFSDEAEVIYRDLTELHVELIPYLMQQGGVAFAEGRSLMTFLDPGHTTWRYQLGEDLFIDPITEPGTSFEVRLPHEGRWTWLFGDNPTYEGGAQVELEVPMDAYPAFVREGSELAETLL